MIFFPFPVIFISKIIDTKFKFFYVHNLVGGSVNNVS